MIFKAIFTGALSLLGTALATVYPTPPDVLYPTTTWVKKSGKSKMGHINAPFTAADGSSDNVHMYRLDLVGTDYERGYAHGALLSKEILEFVEIALPKYYIAAVMNIDVSQYPEPLHTILKIAQAKGALAAPDAMMRAMKWVYDQEEQYMPSYILEEMDGVADGLCNTLGSSCNATEWRETIRTVNMLPELIKMACSEVGAWGEGSETGKLVQLRALDFGGGPFDNYTVAAVYRSEEKGSRAFISITFPAFVGVITGVAQDGIGISEKFGDDHPGAYDGEPDVFVLRDILQQSKTKAEAEAYLASVKRTWAMYVGIGDFATQTMDIVMYQQASAITYTDETMPSVTSQPYLKNVVYVNKHGQPSGYNPNGSDELYTALNEFYGKLSLDTLRTVIQYHQSGDVHIAMYDFGANTMQVAIGRVNAKGDYHPEGSDDEEMWKAYNRPFLRFSMTDLWAGI